MTAAHRAAIDGLVDWWWKPFVIMADVCAVLRAVAGTRLRLLQYRATTLVTHIR